MKVYLENNCKIGCSIIGSCNYLYYVLFGTMNYDILYENNIYNNNNNKNNNDNIRLKNACKGIFPKSIK